MAASSTPSSLEAALTFFGKVKDYDENFERFLISLSVLPRPDVFTLNEIQVNRVGYDIFMLMGWVYFKIEGSTSYILSAVLIFYCTVVFKNSFNVSE